VAEKFKTVVGRFILAQLSLSSQTLFCPWISLFTTFFKQAANKGKEAKEST